MIPLPRPASPRALWRDLRTFFGERRPHQWVAAALALAVPTVIGVTFMFDTMDAQQLPPRIIYVESWPANRSMEEIRAKQVADQRLRDQAIAERQRQFQRLDDRLTNAGF